MAYASIKIRPKDLTEFMTCEEPSYEDHQIRLESGEPSNLLFGGKHGYEILKRHHNRIEVLTSNEAAEVYYRVAAGSFGLYRPGVARRIAKELLPLLEGAEYSKLIDVWPISCIGQ